LLILPKRRNLGAARRFFKKANAVNGVPHRVVIDKSGSPTPCWHPSGTYDPQKAARKANVLVKRINLILVASEYFSICGPSIYIRDDKN